MAMRRARLRRAVLSDDSEEEERQTKKNDYDDELISEVLEDAAKRGSLSDRHRAARALARFRQQHAEAHTSRDRSRSPHSRQDRPVIMEELSGSTGSIAPDEELEHKKNMAKRGGICQRMARSEEYEKYKEYYKDCMKFGDLLRDAARHGSKKLVKEVLDEAAAEGLSQAQVINSHTFHDNHSALWHAVAAGNHEIAKWLVSAGGSPHVEQHPMQSLTAYQLAQKQVDHVPAKHKKHWKEIVSQMDRCFATQHLATCGA
jgi:hypothetical protein